MIKAMTAIVVAVAFATMASTAGAVGVSDDFEGAGYVVGSNVPAPWAACCALQALPDVSAVGFSGQQGAQIVNPGSQWGDASQATGVGAGSHHWGAKFFEATGDIGTTRTGVTVAGGGLTVGFEADGSSNNLNIYATGGGPNVNIAYLENTWYEVEVIGTTAGCGYEMTYQHRTHNGAVWSAWTVDANNVFWAQPAAGPYSPATLSMNLIGHDAGSGLDDIYAGDAAYVPTFIPEPATMALLGLGGLMVLRRRRAA